MKDLNSKDVLHVSLRSLLLIVMTIAFACAFAAATSSAAQSINPVAAIVAVTLFAATFMLTAASLADDFWEDPGINFAAAILGMFTFPFLLPVLLFLGS